MGSNKIDLPRVTLVAVAGDRQAQTIASLYKSLQHITPARTLLITNIDITATGIEVINVGGLNSWELYNRFIVKEIHKYVQTEFFIITQWDSWILDAEQWDDRYYDYSYIGAPWLDRGKPYNVGNGGGSWRSLELHKILAEDENILTVCPEDTAICKVYGQYLMDKYNIKFAPEQIADKFSFELNAPLAPTFMFHAFHHEPFKKTIVFRRSHALGDVIQIEPLLHHFHKLGYRVALDTSDYNMTFFRHHYFPVFPARQLNPLLPVQVVDLDYAYEVKPHQLHLQSYYDFAEVKDGEIRNPSLSMPFNYKHPQNKLFKKYAILHIDQRDEPHRNIYNVDWAEVVEYLNKRGYDVIQVGTGKHENVKGAMFLSTPTTDFLMWAVASSDMFIGIDSGVSHVAAGFNIPSLIFSGSVDLRLIHPDMSHIVWVHRHEEKVCATPFCWHNSVTQSGMPCVVDAKKPPCTQFTNFKQTHVDRVISLAEKTPKYKT